MGPQDHTQVWHPVGHAGVAIKRTATIPHSTLQNRTAECDFVQICRGKGLGGSSSIKFYVFMHDIDSDRTLLLILRNRDSVSQRKAWIRGVPTVRRADCVSPSTNYFLVLILIILHKAMNPEAEHLHCNPAQVDNSE